MKHDMKTFLDAVRAGLGEMTPHAVNGMAILLANVPEDYKESWAALGFAHVYLLTNGGMQPLDPGGETGFGLRGYVPLSGEDAYEKANEALIADVVTMPRLAADPDIAADILWIGARDGWLTGKKLADTGPVSDLRAALGTIAPTSWLPKGFEAAFKTFASALVKARVPENAAIH
jgi:hypothetical protein